MAAILTEEAESALIFSDEETYFLKLAYLLLCHCPAAVRVCFDTEIHPTQLKNELKKNIGILRKVKISQDQWNLLFPPGGDDPTSKSFDITLMVMLLRNIAKLDITDATPILREGLRTTDWALSTIKYYRNQFAHHSESGRVSKEKVTAIFDLVTQAVHVLCPEMSAGCAQILNTVLSPSIVELIKESLKHTQEIETLQENQVSLQTQIDESQKNDGDALQIETWTQNDAFFVEPSVFTDMYESSMDNDVVLITGVSGIGKTMAARHLALKLMNEHGFIPTPCDTLSDVFNKYKKSRNQTFVIDDICGKYKINLEKVENLLQKDNCIANIIGLKKTKIITTCRSDIFNEEAFPQNVLIVHSFYDLSEQYTDKDKMLIAGQYINADESQLLAIARSLTFSPLICSMYSKSNEFRINEFFDSPFEIMCEELDRMKSFNKLKYCLLLLCVLQNGIFDEKFLTEDQDSQEMISCVLELCRLGRDTSRYELLDTANASVGTYLTKECSIFKVAHDKIFDFLCGYFGENMFSTIIRFADTKLLCERTELSTCTHITPHSFAIVVLDGREDEFFNRMKSDIIKGQLQDWMGHLQKSEKALRSILNTFFENVDDSKLSNVRDSINKSGLNLFTASCLNGYKDLVRFLIDHGADVNARNGWFTPLTAACSEGHIQIVNLLITAGAKINETGNFGETPLHAASIGGFIDIVQVLLDNQANLDEKNKYGQCPLYSSLIARQRQAISCLIKKGARINIDRIDIKVVCTLLNDLNIPSVLRGFHSEGNALVNETFLLMATACGYVDLLQQIINNGSVDLNYVNENGDSSLHIASSKDFLKVVETLLFYGAEVDMINKDGETPLHLACKKNNGEIVKLLIKNKALTSIKNKNHISPHDIALQHGYEHTVATFDSQVTTCVDMKRSEDIFSPPLYKECLLNNFDKVQNLIERGADVNMKTEDSDMPLAIACERGYGSIIQLLIEKDADIKKAFYVAINKTYVRAVRILIPKYKRRIIHEPFDEYITPFIIACKKGNAEIILILLKHCQSINENILSQLKRIGADVNQISSHGYSPLMIACTFRNILIANAVDLNHLNDEGKTVFHIACENCDDDIVYRLIGKGANVNQTTSDGSTPLILACRARNVFTVNVLLQNTKNVNHSNNEGKTALHIACENCDDDIVYRLIGKGANVNQTTSDGSTPLILACRARNVFTVNVLLQNTKNVNHSNNEGKTALHIACENCDGAIGFGLIGKGANVNQTISDGSTPLNIACTKTNVGVVKQLLRCYDVNINHSNNEGKTALQIASETHNYEIVELLRTATKPSRFLWLYIYPLLKKIKMA